MKKICFSPKVSIQPCRPKSDSALLGAIWAQWRPKKPGQKAIPAQDRAHFSPGTKSALANWTVLALVVTNLNHFHWLCLYYSVNIDKRSLDIDYINFTFILKSSFGVNKVWCMLLYGSSSRVHSDQTTYNKNLRLRTCIFSSWRKKVLIYINGG